MSDKGKKTVCVLMSTYNGAKYVEEQIESILTQEDINIYLCVRDDCSQDGTIEVLKKYISLPNFKLIVGDKNLGYANSFFSLLENAVNADYYAFADQDDVWKPRKLISAINRLTKDGNPYSLYASNLELVDGSLNYLGLKTFPNYHSSIGSAFSRVRLAGCTMVFGKELRQMLKMHLEEIVDKNVFHYGHDACVLYYSIMLNGNIIIDDNAYILYRRHSSTLTNSSGGIKKRLKNELKIFENKSNRRVKTANYLLKHRSCWSNEHALNVLINIGSYQKRLSIRLKLIFGRDLNTGIAVIDIKNKIAVLMGKY